MKYNGKTIRLANISIPHTGLIAGETRSTLNIDCGILSGASNTMARANTKYATQKSWSVNGEIIFNITQFIAFWHWIAENETCTLAFIEPSFLLQGDAIITQLEITALINSVVKMKFKAIGTGMPSILKS